MLCCPRKRGEIEEETIDDEKFMRCASHFSRESIMNSSLFSETIQEEDLSVSNSTFETTLMNEDFDNTKTEETQMTPLFLFLASSLNVELVYIILTSVTKFVCLERANSIVSVDELVEEGDN